MYRKEVTDLYEALRPCLGAHSDEQVQQVLNVELQRLVPMWTDTRPVCPGWYWYKAIGANPGRLVNVDHGRIDSKLMADLGPPHYLVDVARLPGLWAGPLEPPR